MFARLKGPGSWAGSTARLAAPRPTGLEMIEVAAGPCTISAGATGLAYDSEPPGTARTCRLSDRADAGHERELSDLRRGRWEEPAVVVARGLVVEEQYDITRPGGWTADLGAEWRLVGSSRSPRPGRRSRVLVRGRRLARARGARLPTRSSGRRRRPRTRCRIPPTRTPGATHGATAGPGRGERRPRPPSLRDRAGRRLPDGASPSGCLGMMATSGVDGLPVRQLSRFRRPPYRDTPGVLEDDYRVLRGGSWATRARVAARRSGTGTIPSGARSSPASIARDA